MTVGQLQKLLTTLPDSTRVRVKIPVGTPVDQRFDTYLDLHVEEDTAQFVTLEPHQFDSAAPTIYGGPPAPRKLDPDPGAETPRPYKDWRTNAGARDEDAAYWFGYYLINECRNAALATLPGDANDKLRANAEKAVDTALHNTLDVMEGFFAIDLGENHQAAFRLYLDVEGQDGEVVESVQIAPLDLPIGYWKWKEGGFR